jgi:acetyltransferase
VDIIGDAAQDRYENALSAVIRDENVDGALVILTPQSMTNALATAEAIVRIARRSHKPILCCFMGIVDVSAGVEYLQEHGIPVFRFPENAAKAFGALYRYSKWLNRQVLAPFQLKHDKNSAAELIQDLLDKGMTHVGEREGLALLKCYGFHTLETQLATNASAAADAAEKMGFPVVLKIVSPQIIHKSDAGGVKVGLETRKTVKEAFETIVANAKSYQNDVAITGVIVQKLAPKGEEVILGMNRYPLFGPLIMFGLGGIFVELFADVIFRLAPVNRNSARQMVRHIKGFKLLDGFRGRPRTDLEEIEKSLTRLSDMVTSHPEIQELDINPLITHAKGRGVTVADCRLVLRAVQ